MARALVISGGGSKGAFAVGALRQLAEVFPNLDFDIYVGTSTGSLVVPLAAIHEFALLEQLYTTVKTENIILKDNIGNRINEHSIFNANPLWDLITQFFSDDHYNAILSAQKKLYINAVCLQTGDLTVFTTDNNPAASSNYTTRFITNVDHFRKAIMASACQPVFMPPVKVNKNVPGEPNPNYQFVDGGVREYAGIQMAIDNGATEIFLILLSPEVSTTEIVEYKTLVPILEKTIDIFTTDVSKNDLIIPEQYNEALKYIDAVKNKMQRAGISKNDIDDYFTIRGRQSPYEDKVPIKIWTIRPKESLGGGPGGLTFDPAEMKQMLAKGRSTTNDFVASLDPGDISWA